MELEAEVREFLIECNEYMEVLDRDILALEDSPDDAELIANVFRAVHTIKGTCGFFGFDLLGSLTHVVESILGQVRERERELTPQLVSLILESLDAMRILLGNIETMGTEGIDTTAHLRERLEQAARLGDGIETAQPATAQLILAQLPETVEPAERVEAEVVTATPESAKHVEQAAPMPANATVLPTVAAPKGIAVELHDEEVPSPAARDNGRDAQVADSTIRVDVGLLNRLMNLVGELVLARNQLLQDITSPFSRPRNA